MKKKMLGVLLTLAMVLSILTIPMYGVKAASGDGKTLNTAISVEYGNWYSYATEWYEARYIKVSNNKNCYYNITFKLPSGLDEYDDIRIEVFDSNGKTVKCNSEAKKDSLTQLCEYNIGLFSGTYYIKMTPSFDKKTLSYCVTCYNYDYCETEPTASKYQSQNLNLGYFYKGWTNDDGDYFKFHGHVGVNYRLYINNYTELCDSMAIFHLEHADDEYIDWHSFLYSSEDAIFDPTTMSFYFDFTLKKEGLHYISVYNDHSCIPYAFALTTVGASTPIAPPPTKVTNSKKSISQCAVVIVQPSMIYTGSALKPTVIVKDGNTLLKSGTHYTISYSNNTYQGTGTITITGKGDYKDTVTKTFTISKDTSPEVDLSYRSYVQSFGWQTWVKDGVTSGTSSASRRLEGIQIKLSKSDVSGGVTYRSYVQTYGWRPWVKNGTTSGTMGESKRIEALQIKLTGTIQTKYDIYYRVYAQKFGWLGWAKNGASSGTAGYGYRIESMQIKLQKKGTAAPKSTQAAYKKK